MLTFTFKEYECLYATQQDKPCPSGKSWHMRNWRKRKFKKWATLKTMEYDSKYPQEFAKWTYNEGWTAGVDACLKIVNDLDAQTAITKTLRPAEIVSNAIRAMKQER